MKILLVGNWTWPQYEKSFSEGLSQLGLEIIAYPLGEKFKGVLGRIEHTLPFPGPSLLDLNKQLISQTHIFKPDIVFFWRPTHILPTTIDKINKSGIYTVSYNNDDPFGPSNQSNLPWHHNWLWYWYKKCLPNFNFNYFYRAINCKEALNFGAKHADILMPYFHPDNDRPITLDDDDWKRFGTEIVFVGHYEDDGRDKKIEALIKSGFSVKIWGDIEWNKKIRFIGRSTLNAVTPVRGVEYAKALCGADICLCFLSKINRDVYTRRCFEIPACGRLLLAERTYELQTLFKEDEEACFFSSEEELTNKVCWLLENPTIRNKIAESGQKRVWKDGHDIYSRTKLFFEKLKHEIKLKNVH
jgi:spore maturation protein CgeB